MRLWTLKPQDDEEFRRKDNKPYRHLLVFAIISFLGR